MKCFDIYVAVSSDEFFQSQEIMAGDLLQVHHFIPWEFDPAKPARSSVFPCESHPLILQ
jgi:hypothetical protein